MKRCKLCGGGVVFKFTLRLVRGMNGEYYECTICSLLQSYHLDAMGEQELNDLYQMEQVAELDSGAAWRQYCIVRRIAELVKLRVIPERRSGLRILDLGCGSGFVGSNLSFQFGWRAILYDPYSVPVYYSEKIVRDWESIHQSGPYHIVIASEVFEHFIDPHEQISQIGAVLAEDLSFVYVTTGLYKPGVTDENWMYLAPQSGQHVSLYSKKAIQESSRLLKAHFACPVGGEGEWLFVGGRQRGLAKRLHIAIIAAILRISVMCRFTVKIA